MRPFSSFYFLCMQGCACHSLLCVAASWEMEKELSVSATNHCNLNSLRAMQLARWWCLYEKQWAREAAKRQPHRSGWRKPAISMQHKFGIPLTDSMSWPGVQSYPKFPWVFCPWGKKDGWMGWISCPIWKKCFFFSLSCYREWCYALALVFLKWRIPSQDRVCAP